MALSTIPYRAGVIKDDTAYASEGYATDSKWGRWVRGKFQSMGGYSDATAPASVFTGRCRGLFVWADRFGVPYGAIGTNNKLFIYRDSTFYNVTPIRCQGTFGSNPFATTSGSPTVTCTFANHYASTGDTVYISGASSFNGVQIGGASGSFAASPFTTIAGSTRIICTLAAHGMSSGWEITVSGGSAVGGITVAGTYLVWVFDANTFYIEHTSAATSSATGGGTPTYVIGRPYEVTVTGVSTFTINAGNNASGTGSGGGAAATFKFEISVGLQDSTPGVGYGTGAYGTGPFGVSAGQTVDNTNARTWSFDSNGDELWACPLGGAIYTWSRNISQRATRVLSAPTRNNYMLITTERFAMVFGTMVLGTAGTLGTNPISVTNGSPFATITSVSAGEFQVGDEIALGPITVGGLTLNGNYLVVDTPTTTTIVVATTTAATSTTTGGTGQGYRRNVYSPMQVRHSDGGPNADITVFLPTATNLAGGFRFTVGSLCVGAKNTRSGIYAWTDSSLSFIRYTAQQSSPYVFDLLGTGCGLIGPNAAVEQDGLAWWLNAKGVPYTYAGGVPRPMPCPVKQYLSERLSFIQGYKIWGVFDALYPAVQWLYPSTVQSPAECDSFIRCDIAEAAQDAKAGWVTDEAQVFTAWIDQGILDNQLAATSGGQLMAMESGTDANGATLSRYVTMGPIDISNPQGDGNRVLNARRWVIDADQDGSMNLTITTRRWPNGPETTKGPFAITSATEHTDCRVQGRQMAITLQSNQYFRLGSLRCDLTEGARR